MIKTVCIDDSKKPKEIPIEKWLVKAEVYHVIYTTMVLPQKQLAFHLAEIELTDNELPYEYFLASRFVFTPEDLTQLIELIKDCNETDFSMEELLEQTKLIANS